MTKNLSSRLCWMSAVTFFLFGCSNDFDLTSPSDPIPIVYCIVNPCDSYCYVSLSKTYVTEMDVTDVIINNPQMKVDDASISLEAWGSGYKLWETDFVLCTKNAPVDSGNGGSRSCYRSKKRMSFPNLSLVGSNQKWQYDNLRLIISSPQLKDTVYSRIPIIKGPGNPSPSGSKDINLYGQEDSYFRVKLDKEETKYASFICHFFYQEFTDHWEDKSVSFIVKKDLRILLIDDLLTIRLYEEFFNQLIAAFTDDPAIPIRRFLDMDFELICSDKYFDDYLDTYLNVAAHDMHPYTNITNGYGVFSVTRSTSFHPIYFDEQTLDSLCNGRITKNLRFRLW